MSIFRTSKKSSKLPSRPQYSTNVQENSKEKLILRIPVDDKDLINTPNWISQFIIKKGNEGGNFRIETDPKTNEGLLYVTNVRSLFFFFLAT